MKSKTLLIGLVIIVISTLIAGIAVSVGTGAEQSEAGRFIVTAETQSGIYGFTVTTVTPSSDALLGRYERNDKRFKKYDSKDVIVYFHQRMIDNAIVEGDYVVYQFDMDTKELLHKKTHWRSDLLEHVTPVIIKEQAESMVRGEVQFTKLYIISPDSVVFPLKQIPDNPCWVVRSVDNDSTIVTIIDAMEGKMLGYGIPPPTGFSFSFSGPTDTLNCRGVWTTWYRNAALWFSTMGYPTEAMTYPDEEKVKSHIQSNETVMFYELAHGGSWSFTNNCSDYTDAGEIYNWIASYAKMPFTFIGSCGGMCDLTPNHLSYEFRKGSMVNTTTAGYCGMSTEDCEQAWSNSVNWQDALFDYMNQGDTVKEAFDKAIADYPMCVGCMRFAGDENFALVPVVERVTLLTDVYEPDDNYNQANWLSTDGTKQYHAFHVPSNQDWLRFNATANMPYKIETSYIGDESDTYIYLYDKNGITEITHDDDGGEGLASKIIWSCVTSGTYYIMVRHYSPSSSGPDTYYHISVSQCPPPTFNGVFADYGEDTDGDGLYNHLTIDIGVNVAIAGYYKVEGCLYDDLDNYIEKKTNYTYLNTGNQIVQLDFDGFEIRKNGANGTFDLKHLYLSNTTDGTQLDYIYNAYTTSYYNYTEFPIPPAEFNDVYVDYGEDTDGDGLYDYLVVDVGVNVTEAGDYVVSGYLYENGTYDSVDYDSNTTYLNEGNRTIQLRFEGINIRNKGYNGTYDLKYLYLRSYPIPVYPLPNQLDYRYYAYTTSYYNYTEFQIPPTEFNDVYVDYGEDTDGDGLYDYLVVDVGVNVREAGDYRVSGELYENGTYNSIDYAYNTTYLTTGNQTVQLRFEGIKIRQDEYNGTYDLKYLYLYNSHQFDYRYYAYTTSYYNWTEFQIPPAEFNDIYSDYGEDTNGDELYDYLVVEVGVNVTEAGDYRISGELYDSGGDYIDEGSNYIYLNAGNQTVQLYFNGFKIRQNGVNRTFDLRYLEIYDTTDWILLDYRYHAYTTDYYNYTDFQIPPAEFNGVYIDYGEDTDGDGLYDYLLIDVGVSVIEAGDYWVSGELYENGTYEPVAYDISNTIYLSEGNRTIQLRFEGINIRNNGYNGTYDLKYIYLRSYPIPVYPLPNQLDYRYYAYTTSYYNYTDFRIPPAEFNGVYVDRGEDTDGDGLYDYLVVDVGVNVIEAGDYRVSGELYENGTYNYVDCDSNTTHLNLGSQTVPLRFEGIKIRQNGYNGTYDLKYLGLYNATSPIPPPVPTPTPPPTVPPTTPPSSVPVSQHEDKSTGVETMSVGYGEQLDYRYYAYTTSYYNYTEFRIPPATFNDEYDDYPEDTDGDGLYDYLVVDVGVNVTEVGDYRVSGKLYENGTYDSVDYDSNTTYLEVGNQTVQLRFDAWEITKSGTFDLKYLGLYNATYPYPTPTPVPTATPTPAIPRGSKSKALESVPVGYGEQLDYRYYAYTTGYYEPLPRPALLNDVYSDEGEDTNNPQDGLYNYLVVVVGVNVTEVGNYRISGKLYETGTYNFVDSTSNTVYLNHPGNQTIPLRFEGIKIRNNEYNGTYDLKYLRLFDANYPVPAPTPTPAVPRESKSTATESSSVGYGEQLDYRYCAYTTSYYNYVEFEESVPDAYEPDDKPLLANYISVDGTKQTHNSHIPGDHDWLKFNATNSESYTIETSELGDESDTYLYLYDTDGITEIYHDDDSGISFASKIVWNCSISGTYYVMVRHFSSSAFGPETRYNVSVIVKEAIFDTCSPANPYPSIMGNHIGTIKPNRTVVATKLYTYPCSGTGGHTEYAEIRNATWNATATWEGYVGDWHNITFDKTVVLLENKTYTYTIRTGSYPQIIHEQNYTTLDGSFINCTSFVDANRKKYYDWIPAIRLE